MREQSFQSITFAATDSWKETLAAFYELTKPGITLMVVISTAAGFWLALPKNSHVFLTVDYAILFVLTLLGTALVSAGSCTLNHVIERNHDRAMKRTMDRPIPSGKVRAEHAAISGIALSLLGIVTVTLAHPMTAVLAGLTSFLYLAIYTPLKRKSHLSTLVGGIPGALPPLGGWLTVAGHISMEGVVLFMILFLWQMPHFLSLAWMYRKDYERGGFPMLTVWDESGVLVASNVVVYTVLLVLFSLLLTVLQVTTMLYFIGALVLGVGFLIAGIRFLIRRSATNARTVLLSSYLYLLTLLTLMFIGKA